MFGYYLPEPDYCQNCRKYRTLYELEVRGVVLLLCEKCLKKEEKQAEEEG